MKKNIKLIAVIILIVFMIIAGLAFIIVKHFESRAATTAFENKQLINNTKSIYTEQVNNINNESSAQISTVLPTPMVASSPIYSTSMPIPTVNVTKINDRFASIEISTLKRIRTYEIMPDVKESTLKENIGWLPSSSLPYQDGLCTLMGHRDTDFSILQHVEIGDEFYIHMNGSEYTYSVSVIEIVNSDNELRFNAHNGSTLVLVSCYPFRYTGHAPQKIVVYAKRNV